MKPKLLIVDDDEEIRTQMNWALGQDYDVILAADRESGLKAFKEHRPRVVLLDLGLPPAPADPTEGLTTLSELLGLDQLTKIVIITGQGEKENALRAVGDGACDFLSKPLEIEELQIILKRALHMAALESELAELRGRSTEKGFEGLLGVSPAMQEVFAIIRKVAKSDAPVLILGESGTGKEAAALAIHRRSSRRDGPFVTINCGAIPATLLESELFGHEKGAFTGAHVQRPGRIEIAAGGTVFLDEIGELPVELQVKILRLVQEQRIERIGGRKEIQIDARFIAATNSDLQKAMQEGRFREDLYYRLAVVVIRIPPLRDRPDDIPLLAHTFLQRFASKNAKGSLKFSQEALRSIVQYHWPGNVRELQNRIKRAVILTESSRLMAPDLELENNQVDVSGQTLKEAREALEREMLLQALRRNGGKISPAAVDLGISRPKFYELMEKLGIKKESHCSLQ